MAPPGGVPPQGAPQGGPGGGPPGGAPKTPKMPPDPILCTPRKVSLPISLEHLSRLGELLNTLEKCTFLAPRDPPSGGAPFGGGFCFPQKHPRKGSNVHIFSGTSVPAQQGPPSRLFASRSIYRTIAIYVRALRVLLRSLISCDMLSQVDESLVHSLVAQGGYATTRNFAGPARSNLRLQRQFRFAVPLLRYATRNEEDMHKPNPLRSFICANSRI